MSAAPTTHDRRVEDADRSARHPAAAAVWFLPAFGVLTLWATSTHQPSPTTDFAAWARFVTTDEFLAKHVLGSILGLALNLVGVAALTAVILGSGRRLRAARWGFFLSVMGSAGLLAGFGVAAFAQPAIGTLELQGYEGARAVHDDVYAIPAFVTLIGGGFLFAVGTVLLARTSAAVAGVHGWVRFTYGTSGPLIAFLGIAFGPLQTLGSIAAIVGGAGLAMAVRRGADPVPTWSP